MWREKEEEKMKEGAFVAGNDTLLYLPSGKK